MIAIWLKFMVCAVIITLAGAKLSRYADVIAEKTKLSASWLGLILLASVTSLPELVTGISAVTIAAVPNIAVGDVFGSCVFNLLILVILDFLQRGESVYRRASQGHILSAGFGCVLIGFAGLNLFIGDKAVDFGFAHIGMYAPIIVLLYIIAMRGVFNYERAHRPEHVEDVTERYAELTLQQTILRYLLAAMVVVGAGSYLPFVGAELADVMGWHKTFVGTLFVAGATSLPELVVTISAFRLGALDMAIANLLGSNLFNIFILTLDDVFYLKGPILAHVSPLHTISAISAVIMTGIAIVGLIYRPDTRLFKTVGWTSLGLFTVYLLNSYVLFLHGE